MKRVTIIFQCLFVLLLTAFAGSVAAQQSKKLIAEGNQLYQKGKYKEATLKYGQALRSDTAGADAGTFNLGNALYQQKQLDAARQAYAANGKRATDKTEKARADYNTGNTYMKERKWQEAVDAYKNALRKNPQDADAKYNLSYAQTMLKHDNNGGGGKDKNKDKDKDKKDQDKKDQDKKDQQNKDQNKDQQDKNKDQDKKDQQGQPKDQDNKEDQQGQHPQPQPSKLSQQQADQLLNALQQEEKKLQDKKKKVEGTPVRMEKDW